jgi:hypothetical protein
VAVRATRLYQGFYSAGAFCLGSLIFSINEPSILSQKKKKKNIEKWLGNPTISPNKTISVQENKI